MIEFFNLHFNTVNNNNMILIYILEFNESICI